MCVGRCSILHHGRVKIVVIKTPTSWVITSVEKDLRQTVQRQCNERVFGRRIFQHFDMTMNSRIIGAAAASPAAPLATPMNRPFSYVVFCDFTMLILTYHAQTGFKTNPKYLVSTGLITHCSSTQAGAAGLGLTLRLLNGR